MSRLTFTEVKDTGKTKVWDVHNNDHGAYLGQVKWRSGWRQYVYTDESLGPDAFVIWSGDCLAELTEFVNARMSERN
jgi:hypothetical protein